MTTDTLDTPIEDQFAALTQGNLIERKIDLKAKIAALNSELSELKKLEDAIDQALIAKLDAEGTTKATGRGATVSIQESVVPSVRDWESFYQFIADNNYFHLLERRPSATGCRELFERHGSIPGVEPFNKRSLRFSSST